ncbi:hypothetical protein ACH49_25995 [Streptomyces leeuwenhoekii]|uniref:Uncharacterized protein n=1 Tax=Streptomyces leeuwenhoekii TaxID=1437453 RepID=A0ABR5HSC4_STRLW|nr:hypothetical protein [Streptomyces leeuwenhoekii]KMS69796.1 hypothetical protein ACH49_25995 [Streptomyces leeuwenhoekii]
MGRRIRITSVTSVSDGAGRRYGHGQVVEVDDELAAAWIAAGHAEPHSGTPTSQSADRPVRQAADGRRRATRRAPRDAGAKAAGATDAEAAAVRGNDQDNNEDGSTSSDGQ